MQLYIQSNPQPLQVFGLPSRGDKFHTVTSILPVAAQTRWDKDRRRFREEIVEPPSQFLFRHVLLQHSHHILLSHHILRAVFQGVYDQHQLEVPYSMCLAKYFKSSAVPRGSPPWLRPIALRLVESTEPLEGLPGMEVALLIDEPDLGKSRGLNG